MKSVIVFYIPVKTQDQPDPVIELQKLEESGFQVILIEDPARTKIETEVFFNPF